jgi:N-acetyl sugar amidotransferase
MIIVLDKQFDELPRVVQFCTDCVVSNQRPRTLLDENGVCSACQWAHEKDHMVDWEARERALQALCDRFRSKDGSFDVVVPGSGGKDSGFVAHQLRDRYGMNPLCCTWAPFDWTDIGWYNLRAFVRAGFDNLLAQPNGDVHRRLSRLALEAVGDAWQPFAYGQKAWAFHIAEKFNIRLIFYGENGELEYGGSVKYKDLPKEGPEEWEYEYYKGASVDRLIDMGVQRGLLKAEEARREAMRWYKAPHPDLIRRKQIEMHWFSYYKKWVPQENYYYAVRHTGFMPNPEGRTESTYTKYASLDDKADGFHFYLGYMKFGLGRASRDAQQDIRRGHLTRDEGVRLVRRFDHEFPQRHFTWFLEYLDIDEDFFWQVMDAYRERSNVWEKIGGEWVMTAPVV